FARSRPTQLTAGDEFEVRVSCVRDGHVGSATTNALADDALRDCARRAGLAADLAAQTGSGVFPGLPAPADTPTPHTGWDEETVADLLDFTGALAFNGLAYAEGRSALSDRLGKRVAAPGVNLSDSPRFHATLPRAFDAEGVPKTPLPLIQDGIAHRVVHDTRS